MPHYTIVSVVAPEEGGLHILRMREFTAGPNTPLEIERRMDETDREVRAMGLDLAMSFCLNAEGEQRLLDDITHNHRYEPV